MMTRTLAALAAAIAVCLSWSPDEPRAAPPKKIGLIVAIGTYAPSTGWATLATANDEKAIRDALRRQGFQDSDVETLADDRATGPAIVAAFRGLIKRAEPGTIAVFHYSGHGHRITDDNGDEPDGYDEVLVPFDAPRDPPRSYKGQKHVRDDELNTLVRELRRAVGPTGDVVISIDSCYSGSAARSAFATAQARGELTPIGPPQGGRKGQDTASGFDEAGAGGPSNAPLAPYLVISASRHDELAWETTGSDNKAIGALSLALSKALNRAAATTTYRALFDDLQRTMAAVVVNTPQIEGMQDREILGGHAVTQEPFYRIKSYDRSTRRARLTDGSLAGLFTGSRVAVHPAGTAHPKREDAIAVGTVTVSDLTESIVELEDVRDPQAVAAGWMFVTDQSFGTLQSVVRIDAPSSASWVASVRAALSGQRFVSIGSTSPDFIVAEEKPPAAGVSLRAAADFRLLLGPLDVTDPELAAKIARRVKDASHNRYLRSLAMTGQGFNASFEIAPCELACSDTPFGPRCDCARPLDRRVTRPAGGDLTLALGDGFRIKLRNQGEQPVYISVLDLQPDGAISLLWPLFEHSGNDNLLPRGAEFTVSQPWRVTRPTGVEDFKLIASLQQIDFRPITSRGFAKLGTRGPLDNLFIDAFDGTRAEATLPASSVHTQDITVRVVEKRSP